jgi:hypothetical protein
MQLEGFTRKELQNLAKEHGIKANLSTAAIIEALQAKLAAEIPVAVEHEIKQNEAMEIIEEAHDVYVQLPHIQLNSIKVSQSPTVTFQNGDRVDVILYGVWLAATIKRVNKSSVRIVLNDGQQMTVKQEELRHSEVEEPGDAEDSDDAAAAVDTTDEIQAKDIVTEIVSNEEVTDYMVDGVVGVNVEEFTSQPMETMIDATVDIIVEDIGVVDGSMIASIDAMVTEEAVFCHSVSNVTSTPKARKSFSRASFPRSGMKGLNKIITSLTPKSSRKTFATSPEKAHPSIEPKTNAAHRLRLEALQNKRRSEIQQNQVSAYHHSLFRLKDA